MIGRCKRCNSTGWYYSEDNSGCVMPEKCNCDDNLFTILDDFSTRLMEQINLLIFFGET
jgi:hypothetical protein